MDDTSPTAAAIHEGIGTLIMAWNRAEHTLRALLRTASSGGVAVRILVETMEVKQLCPALLAVVEHHERADLVDYARHAVEVFEAVRTYRNFYVHEMLGPYALREEDQTLMAISLGKRVQRRAGPSTSFEERSTLVTAVELQFATSKADEIGRYLSTLIHHLTLAS